MKKVPSIIDFADGSVVDRINFELAKLIENIKNPNTDEKVRTLEIKIKLTPKNGRRSIDAEYSVVGKPRPISPVNASMVVQQSEGRDQLLVFLKTVSDIEGVEIGDDGVTQRVTTQSTVSGAAAIPPIQRLAPYRTFSEIMQPESDFLFRVRKGGEFALFEADGGAWKHKARENIAEYYRNEFTDLINEGKVIILS